VNIVVRDGWVVVRDGAAVLERHKALEGPKAWKPKM
jgi:hypothetical protein